MTILAGCAANAKAVDRRVSTERSQTETKTSFFGGIARFFKVLFSPLTCALSLIFGNKAKQTEKRRASIIESINQFNTVDGSTAQKIDRIIKLLGPHYMLNMSNLDMLSEINQGYENVIASLPIEIRDRYRKETALRAVNRKTPLQFFESIKRELSQERA